MSDCQILWLQSPSSRSQAALTVCVKVGGGWRWVAPAQNWEEGIQALLKMFFSGCLLPLYEQLLAPLTLQEARGRLPVVKPHDAETHL